MFERGNTLELEVQLMSQLGTAVYMSFMTRRVIAS
jgi:hypothetical protein